MTETVKSIREQFTKSQSDAGTTVTFSSSPQADFSLNDMAAGMVGRRLR